MASASSGPGAARLDHTDPPSGKRQGRGQRPFPAAPFSVSEGRREGNAHIQNKSQAGGYPDTRGPGCPPTSPRAQCQGALAPARGTLGFTPWQARADTQSWSHRVSAPCHHGPNTWLRFSVCLPNLQGTNRPCPAKFCLLGHRGRRPSVCQPGSVRARAGPFRQLGLDTSLGPRKAWAPGSSLDTAGIKLPGTQGRRVRGLKPAPPGPAGHRLWASGRLHPPWPALEAPNQASGLS